MRSSVSRRTSAAAEARRIPTIAAQAFIDRAPIDWMALRSRVRSSRERLLIENLHALDLFRRTIRGGDSVCASAPRPPVRFRLVGALGAVQTLCSLALFALSAIQGADVSGGETQVAVALAFAAGCAVLGRGGSHDPRRLWLLATFLCAAGAFARGALSAVPAAWAASSALLARALVIETFMPACLWHFARDFPRVHRFAWYDVLAKRATSAAWILGLSLFLVNAAAAAGIVPERAVADLLAHRRGAVFWGVFAILCLPAVAAILFRSWRAPSLERKKVARVALALGGGGAPFLLVGLARTLVPDVDGWIRVASPSDRIWLDAIVIGSLSATPMLTTTVVMADRAFESWTVPSSPKQRSIVGGLIGVAAAAFAALGLLFSDVRAWLLWGCAATLGARHVFRSCGSDIASIERRPFVGGGGHHERLGAALDALRTARGDREIAAVLGRELRRGTGASTARILIADAAGTLSDPFGSPTRLRSDAGLCRVLRDAVQPLDLSAGGPLLRLLCPPDREWLLSNGIELAVPLKARDGALAALVILGPRDEGGAFSRRERWFAAALANAAAPAWNDAAPAGAAIASTPDQPDATDGEAAFECPRCGRVSGARPTKCCPGNAALAALPRRLAGKFVVQRRIGSGGMGVVYLARDLRLGRPVALKTLPRIRFDGVARLRAEARAMASLSHESLATIYGLEMWRRVPVLVLEYFPAGTLAARLRRGSLDPRTTLALGVDLARAVDVLHTHGVLHRDLKPSNIALTATGSPRILDFGLVSLAEAAERLRPGFAPTLGPDDAERAGTLGYFPPEAFRPGPVTHQFDLWALGVILLETLTGNNPFLGRDRAATIERIVDPQRRDVSSRVLTTMPAWTGFFDRALALEPEKRFQSAREMAAALEAFSS